MEFREKFEKERIRTEEIVYEYLPKEGGFQHTVISAMNYSVTAGGKRIRPIMMEQVFRMCGGTSEIVQPFMAAMEFLHTYSLVHDDLPAMDNDEFRRGKKTTWAEYGEGMAVLAGDGLLNYAYEVAAASVDRISNEKELVYILKALKVFTNKSGIYGMVGGQTVDVLSSGVKVSREKLDFIYRLKTGALIEASLMMGAILAGASDELVDAFEKIGINVGLAFQIQDDVLDVCGTEEETGKPMFSDDKNEKTTYVTLEGLDYAKAEVKRLTDEAKDILASLEAEHKIQNTEFFIGLIEMLQNRKN
jgi:geranylgeranyl diphosphate synthase type II